MPNAFTRKPSKKNSFTQKNKTIRKKMAQKTSSDSRIFIGVVGTSRNGVVSEIDARAAVDEALSKVPKLIEGRTPVLVSGAGVVPQLAFEFAKRRGWEALQIVSRAVKGKAPVGVGLWSHGDESRTFVSKLDAFVRVGGGPQSHRYFSNFCENIQNFFKITLKIDCKCSTRKTIFFFCRELEMFRAQKGSSAIVVEVDIPLLKK